MRRCASGVNYPLRDPLVVKMRDLLAHDEIFQQRRAPLAGFQSVLIIRNAGAGIGGQRLTRRILTGHLKLLDLFAAIFAIWCVSTGQFALGLLAGHGRISSMGLIM